MDIYECIALAEADRSNVGSTPTTDALAGKTVAGASAPLPAAPATPTCNERPLSR